MGCSVYTKIMSGSTGFEEQVRTQVERLRTKKLATIEEEVIAKRTAWFDNQIASNRDFAVNNPGPRFAFETIFFRYMGLQPEDLPVVQENDDEIVWSSQNACPTLEACRQLHLDTRVVCRNAYEKSTQALLSRMDPHLRFLRDYRQIRPAAKHCLERIVRVRFEDMMEVAIAEAHQSRKTGNKGYGAVAALGNQVIARGHDTAASEHDPSLHAEVNVLRAANRVLEDVNLSGVILFSTCEPCPMCASLAVWANVSAIVFGASIEATAAKGKARILVPALEIVARSPARIEVIGGVLEAECLSLY